jgi:hypothetical protein
VPSANEYFDNPGIGNEPRQGGGSIIMNSYSVNYDGLNHHPSSFEARRRAEGPERAKLALFGVRRRRYS